MEENRSRLSMLFFCLLLFVLIGGGFSIYKLTEISMNKKAARDVQTAEVETITTREGKNLHDLFVEVSDTPVADGQDTSLGMASAFATLARMEGYQARVVTSSVLSADGRAKEHSFVLISRNGKEYIFDPAAQAQFGNQADFFGADPLDPPIRYVYPQGEEPLGGYRNFAAEELTESDQAWEEFAAS